MKYARIQVELREVTLRAKPAEMLSRSPKGTVPVLCLPDGTVLEQSLDIMRWALEQNDPDSWLAVADIDDANALIAANDGPFKDLLDRYKYADRHPDQPASGYRKQAEECFIAPLEKRLSQHNYLCGGAISFVDVAIMPFVRQFAMSDEEWFAQSPYSALRNWLARFVESVLFDAVMMKHAAWQPGSPCIVL